MVDIADGENAEQGQLENNEMGGDQLEEAEVKTQYKILSKKKETSLGYTNAFADD